jgi:hypothetical protein
LKPTKYQVFISSTYSDLKEEREGVIKAILELYHIPIGMEMFSAEDEDQWEIIRRTIEVSDYYILILGLRYGSKTSEGISFTQKEYKYALEQKIPILAFVMSEGVSLPKDKRDDNLTEINEFRNTVLKNSKMSQFWTNRDELIKNVSISLMKQIMQKPGVGWVRGDKANSEETLSKELATLSKENRELREVIADLESKISPKRPQFELTINPIFIGNKYNSCKKVFLPEKIGIDDVEKHLREYITEEEIQAYNNKIPSQSEIDEFNNQLEKSHKIRFCSSPLIIKIRNVGTVKANNVYIDIIFPDSLLIFTKGAKIGQPKSPIPDNPIHAAQAKYHAAQAKYEEELQESINPFLSVLSKWKEVNANAKISMPPPTTTYMESIRPINQTWWTKLEGNHLTIKIDSLLHTRYREFDDEYVVVPLKSGKHKIEIICEELESKDNQIIEIDIQEKL